MKWFKAMAVFVLSVFAPPIIYMFVVNKTFDGGQNINEGIAALMIFSVSALGAAWFVVGSLIQRKLMLRNLVIFSAFLSVFSGIYAANLRP